MSTLSTKYNDFLDRDSQTFIKARVENRLDWESTLENGTSYAEFLLKGFLYKTKQQLIAKAYEIGCNFISTICPMRVQVFVHPSESFATSSRKIYLDTSVFDDNDLTDFEQVDVLIGEAVHEGLHIILSDFSIIPKNKIKKAINNILEDERIERYAGEHFPGYSRFLEKVKYYFFDKLHQSQMPDYDAMTDGQQLFSLFFNIVRYPKYLREKDLIKFEQPVDKIVEALTPYPDSPQHVAKATDAVYNILKEYYDEQEAEQPESEADQPSKGKNSKSSGGRQGKDDADIEEELDNIAVVINEQLSSSNNKSEIEISEHIISDPISAQVLQGTIERGTEKETYFLPQPNDYDTYQRNKNEVSAYASTLKRLIELSFQNKTITTKGMRSGLLDTGKFPEATMGVSNIYEQHRKVKSNQLAMGLLVDESGSMHGSSIDAARKCAILFNEAFHKSPWVDLYVYGHSADYLSECSTELYVYKEPNHNPKFGIGSIRSRSMNRDGMAILQTAKRIRKFTDRKCILFVISDGQPSAEYYSGKAAIQDTKKCVEIVEKMGFVVIQIAISTGINSKEMFTNYVLLTNISSLPRDLAKVAKKAIRKLA